jgi:hypothetical protein
VTTTFQKFLISYFCGQENLLVPEAFFLRLFDYPMRILLIGGNGFIGRFAVSALTQQGHALAVFHRGTAAMPAGVEEIRGTRNQLSSSAQELKRFVPDVVIDLVISSGAQAEELFLPCLEHAGLRRFRFHDLRHTFGSLLIQDGASLAYVKDQMGHSSIQITVDTYGHLIPGADINWIDGLDRRTSSQQNATPAQLEVLQEASESLEVVDKDGERGRNRTFNLLIKSYVSRCGCTVGNCSRHNNLTITRPAWTVSEKRWESWRNRTTSNCEGHKKDTAKYADSPDGQLITFRQLRGDRRERATP